MLVMLMMMAVMTPLLHSDDVDNAAAYYNDEGAGSLKRLTTSAPNKQSSTPQNHL